MNDFSKKKVKRGFKKWVYWSFQGKYRALDNNSNNVCKLHFINFEIMDIETQISIQKNYLAII